MLWKWVEQIPRWAQQRPREFFLILGLSRLLLLAVRLPALFWLPFYSEYQFWWEMMQQHGPHGWYPFLHYWTEYPPVMPWVVTGLYQLSVAVCNGSVAQGCFYSLFGLMLIGLELIGLALLFQAAKKLGVPQALRAATFFAVGFLPFYVWTGWWDVLPIALLLAAWLLLVTGRTWQSAILVGVGALTKLFPLLVLPIALCILPTWRRKFIYLAITVLTIAGFLLPFALLSPDITKASLQNMTTRPSWETVWALIDGYYSYGLVAPIGERTDPASALAGSHHSSLPTGALTLGFGLVFALIYLRLFWLQLRQRTLGNRVPMLTLALSISLLLLYSQGYSPQYLMWLTPWLAILYPERKMFRIIAILLINNLIELPVYLTFFPDQTWLLFVTVITRSVILLWLALVLGRDLFLAGSHPISLDSGSNLTSKTPGLPSTG